MYWSDCQVGRVASLLTFIRQVSSHKTTRHIVVALVGQRLSYYDLYYNATSMNPVPISHVNMSGTLNMVIVMHVDMMAANYMICHRR